MVEEYKVRSGFKSNSWAMKKFCGLQLCAFIYPCHQQLQSGLLCVAADSNVFSLPVPAWCWCSLRQNSACLSTCLYELKQAIMPWQSLGLLDAPDSSTSKPAAARWASRLGHVSGLGWMKMKPKKPSSAIPPVSISRRPLICRSRSKYLKI